MHEALVRLVTKDREMQVYEIKFRNKQSTFVKDTLKNTIETYKFFSYN
jgi:hypothetical protein